MVQPLARHEPLELVEVDNVLQRAIVSGDPLIITQHANQLRRKAIIKGVALAKLLYGLRDVTAAVEAPEMVASGVRKSCDTELSSELRSRSVSICTRLRSA